MRKGQCAKYTHTHTHTQEKKCPRENFKVYGYLYPSTYT